jgi:hypothetical protein
MSHQRLRLLDHPHSRMMTSGVRFTMKVRPEYPVAG